MAKSKRRKKKKKMTGSHEKMNPAKYIKSRARSLPIAECYITKEWKDNGLASILVTRKHAGGTRTFGMFLVDLQCLGIKDAAYQFNIPEHEFEDNFEGFIDEVAVACEYELAHNIIYGALEYAEEYGFSPHKDWDVAQYILEEDNDAIPVMDISFGDEDGKPLYFAGPYESQAQRDMILKTLERTAGEGNFHFVMPSGEGDLFGDEDNDQLFDDELKEDDWDDDELADDELFVPDEIKNIMDGEKEPTLRQGLTLLAVNYRMAYPNDEVVDVEKLEEAIIIDAADRDDESNFRNAELLEELEQISEVFEEEQMIEQLDTLHQLRKKYGDDPLLLHLIFTLKVELENTVPDEIVTVFEEMYPDNLDFRFLHAQALINKGNLDKAWVVLGENLSMDDGFPERSHHFFLNEVIMFNATMCRYFLARNELGKALNYGVNALLKDEENPIAVSTATDLNIVLFKVLQEEE